MAELDEGTRRVIARRYPEAAGRHGVVIITADDEMREMVLKTVSELVRRINDADHRALEDVVEGLLPCPATPSPHLLDAAKREAIRRQRIIADFGALTAAELAEAAGSSAGNRSQLAYQWRARRHVFSVKFRGATLYPAFQFGDDGRPYPVVQEVLRHLDGWPGWEIATWFVVANPHMELRRPVDLLASEPNRVAEAAMSSGPPARPRRSGPRGH